MIYVASSWRCPLQPVVVRALAREGFEPYDFKAEASAFNWREVATEEQLRNPVRFRDEVLTSPLARRGFEADMAALRKADALVMVLPCGRSAHLELGFAIGAFKKTVVLLDTPLSEPELMYLAADHLCVSIPEVVTALRSR